MNYKIINATVLDENGAAREGCEVLVSSGRIVDSLPSGGVRTIDARGGLVMRGFNNCHTHSAMTLLRGYAEDLPLHDWLYNKVFPFEELLTEEDVYWGTRLAILEYLAGGTTAIGEMYFHYDGYANAVRDSGFKAAGIISVADIKGDTEERLINAEDYYNKYRGDKNVTMRLGYHAEYTASDALLRGIGELCSKYGERAYSHVSETRHEHETCVAQHGKTPLMRAVESGIFAQGGAVYHGIYLTDEDIEVMRALDIAVVTNPTSNLKLASGIAPVCKYLSHGLKVAIGTDGAASNNALDMFREMNLCASLQKYLSGDAAAMPARHVLQMATSGGRELLGIDDGSSADLVIIDLNAASLNPRCDISNALVFAGNPSCVKLTMVNGRILYENGKFFVGEKPEQIISKCNDIVKRVLSEL